MTICNWFWAPAPLTSVLKLQELEAERGKQKVPSAHGGARKDEDVILNDQLLLLCVSSSSVHQITKNRSFSFISPWAQQVLHTWL